MRMQSPHTLHMETTYFAPGTGQGIPGAPSILDVTNRTWLRETYGTRIVSLEELAAELNG